MAAAPLVTLLTDFGTADYYVAAVRGTLHRLAPGLFLADLSHELPPGDVEAAADLLAAAAPTFPEGTVHLAVVDPGVGSERRILAVEWAPSSADGAGRAQRFVAPDNGLLTPFLEELGRGEAAGSVRSVERTELFQRAPGSTFHGRDRFAPVAAALARAEPLDGLGPEIGTPVLLERPRPRRTREGGTMVLVGRVVRVDRFGNLVTDLPAEWLAEVESAGGGRPRVEIGRHSTEIWVDHYAELPSGEAGALVGSLGTVELSLRGESLTVRWEVERGAPVRVVPASR